MAVTTATTGDAVTDADEGEAQPVEAPPEADSTTDRGSLRRPALAAVLVVVALAGLCTYLGVRAYQAHQVAEQRNLFLGVARQGAVNLTTIDWQTADADVQRILDSASGPFYDDFSQRSQPFVNVVKQMQSKSVGTVTEAAIESESGNDAQVLVTVSVATTNPAAPEQSPRNWRMRMSVEQNGDEAKVSNVEFVA
jgi:Mce-associated membrane protein